MSDHIQYPEEKKAQAIAYALKTHFFKCSECGSLIPIDTSRMDGERTRNYFTRKKCPGCGARIVNHKENYLDVGLPEMVK